MSNRIAILPEKLCNQIAAGEVVERPASVVKELVENALDAGAQQITIEIELGGRRRIRVSDDGCGMNRQDVFLCFERHATSKIRTEADLFALHSLGFRGEALPSIAAVARLTLASRHADEAVGMQLELEGGVVRRVQEIGRPAGSCFDVRDLFFNLPARRKFLRQAETEFGHISDVVTRLALAYPAVQFRLLHNGRKILDCYRHQCLLDRIAAVLGQELAGGLLAIGGAQDELRLSGFIGTPELSRSTSQQLYTFVNGRYLRDRLLHHALMDAYRQVLLKGRYPVCVLFLTLPSAQVDVNVHPTKHEVRFQQQQQVHDFLSQQVRDRLRQALSRSPEPSPFPVPAVAAYVPCILEPETAPTGQACAVAERVAETGAAVENYRTTPLPAVSVPSAVSLPPPQQTVVQQDVLPLQEGFFSHLRLIGQLGRSYLLCEDDGQTGDLLLIDQHAAHERIGYEHLRQQYEQQNPVVQELLFPVVLELSLAEQSLMQNHQTALTRLGFVLHPFGGRSWSLTAVPALLAQADLPQLVRDMLAELEQWGRPAAERDALDALLIRLACHTVVRANETLTIQQMRGLLQQLDQVDFNRHCPHGRPVMQRLQRHTIEKLFHRQ